MEQEDSVLSPSKLDKEIEETSNNINNIEDINELATTASQQVKFDREDFIEEKLDKRAITKFQKSTGGGLAIALISIYGATILLCFVVIFFGVAIEDRKEILTLIITSQVTLVGSAIGFYLGKNQ